MTILIGCDPELFVYTQTGVPVSAHDLLPGTKWEPFEVSNGAIQVDGVAAEFNIKPAATEEEFLHNIAKVEHDLLEKLLEKRKGLVLRASPVIKFTRKQWNEIPESAKMLGCEPDWDAYSLTHNVKPETNKFMRTGSGHIHISWGQTPNDVKKPCVNYVASLVHHLDYHLYPQSLLWDKDKERQELYGKPGAMRPKDYGVEYRTLSNRWVADEKTIRYVFRTAKLCTEKWMDGYKPDMYKVEPYAA